MRYTAKGVFVFCLTVSSFSCFAQLPGFEQALAGDASVGLAAGDQQAATISEGDGVQLVVWGDERANPYVYYEYETSSDIYGMRLDANGDALDPVPFSISSARGSQTGPQVAWNGSHWLVVFNTTTLSGTGFYYGNSLAAVRVAPDGTVIDEEPIPVFSEATNGWAVASDGNQWVLVAQGNGVTGDIVAIRISAAGQVLDPPTRTLVEETYYMRSGLRLASAGGVFMLTYSDNGTKAVRFDSALNPIDAAPLELLSSSLSDLASNGSEFFVAWNQQLADFSLAAMGSRVSSGGVVLDGAGINVSGAFSPDASGGAIAVAWDGSDWRISWPNGGGTRVARVSGGGALPVPGGTALSNVIAGRTAGTGAGGLQIAWADFNDNEYDVFAATIDVNDTVLAKSGISTSTPMQYRTEVAAGANGYMVVYRSRAAGQVRILAQPLDGFGQSLLPEPVELAVGTNLSGPGSPAVAWNGLHFLVAWSTPAGVECLRLSEDGTAVDADAITVMSDAFGPVQVAAAGNDFLVTGLQTGIGIHFVHPVAARVSAAGAVLDARPITLGGSYARSMEVVELGGRWLVVWHRSVTHDDPLTETLGVFVETDGSAGTPFPVHGYFSINGGNSIFTVGLASSGDKALFVQSQERTSGVETDLLAHLVEADGTVGPEINLTPWQGNQYRPDVSFDGADFIVTYHDQKNRIAAHTLDPLDARSDIYGMRLTPAGQVLDPQGFLVADSPLGETDAAVASLGSETLILASQLQNDGINASYRVRVSEALDGGNRMPVAQATASVTNGDIPLTVEFSSGGSADPEGAALTYLWQFADGGRSTQPNPSHTFTLPGEYPVILTVFDDQAQPTSQGVTIVATAPNQLPVAVATASTLEGPAPLSATLYANGSYDPDGSLGNIEWNSSDGRRYFGSPAYFTFSSAGTYDVTLKVYDSRGAFSEDKLTLVVTNDNRPPTAVASANPSTGPAPLLSTLSAAGSSDPDGSLVSYAWDFGDGSTGSGANPTHLYAGQGSYTATLTVTDNSGASASASVAISVNGVSETALLTSIDLAELRKRGVASVVGDVTVTNGSGQAERSAIVTGRWTLPDGSSFTRSEYTDRKGVASFSTSVRGDGVYTLELTNVTKSGFVWAEGDSETSDALTLGGGTNNQDPTASFTFSCSRLNCSFDGSGSTDPDGSIVSYSWSFGDGGTGAGLAPSHAFSAEGTYTVSLTVTDDRGASAGTSRSVSVTNEPPPNVVMHVGDLDSASAEARRNRWNATVTVRVHDADEAPIANATVSGSWSGGANGSGSCATASTGVCTISKSNLKANVASLTFTVGDISLTGASYDAGSNHDPDADSNGTAIVITR